MAIVVFMATDSRLFEKLSTLGSGLDAVVIQGDKKMTIQEYLNNKRLYARTKGLRPIGFRVSHKGDYIQAVVSPNEEPFPFGSLRKGEEYVSPDSRIGKEILELFPA